LQKLNIGYHDNLFTVSAKDVDLKKVLSQIADKTNTFVWFPDSLEKKITIELTGTSLSGALKRLLKGINHVIIYSGPSEKKAAISEIYILPKAKRTRRVKGSAIRITNRIRGYERRIESLKKRLSKIDENSRRGKSYLKQIRRLENNIEGLSRQLN
jgi:predicted RNase H-like nuclease (RuvC/YqgF family)